MSFSPSDVLPPFTFVGLLFIRPVEDHGRDVGLLTELYEVTEGHRGLQSALEKQRETVQGNGSKARGLNCSRREQQKK